MPFDGIAMHAVVCELQSALTGSRIMKIYQPKNDELLISLYQNTKEYKFLISANSYDCRMHLTEGEVSNPASPPMFCMLLRKHLMGGRLKQIEQKNLERIAEITIQNVDEYMQPVEYKLIIEIMGKHSNIILLNQKDNTIIDAIKRISSDVNRYREILPGEVYIAPPMNEKMDLLCFDRNFVYNKLLEEIYSKEEKKICQWLIEGFMGISGTSAQELVFRANIDKRKGLQYLNEDEISSLLKVLDELSADISQRHFSPCLYKDTLKGGWEDFWVFPLTHRNQQPEALNLKDNNINKAVDLFYTKKLEMQNFISQKNEIISELKRHLKKLNQNLMHITKRIDETKDMEKYRLWGELLSAYMYMVKARMKEIVLPNFETGKEVVIPLNEKYSPSRNAQNYFNRYKKLNAARGISESRKKELQEEINFIENELVNLDNCQNVEDLQEIYQEVKKQGYIKGHTNSVPFEKKSEPYKFKSSDGFMIYVGKNNRQNDMLTLKKARPDDMWFHTKEVPGSHVIVESNGKAISDKTIAEACMLAAYFSKAKNGSNVPVDYTQKKYVRKPNGAKPGFVIYDHHRTMYVTPDKSIIDKLLL